MIRPFSVDTSTFARTYYAAQFPIYDGHGNLKCTLTRSGSSPWYTISNSRSYDVWGGVRDGSATGDPNTRYCANLGHKQDDESGTFVNGEPQGDGLIYMRARYYEPGTGRFISEDPARDGRNWYVYCGNEPVKRADRTGRSFASEIVAFIGLALIILGGGFAAKGTLQYMDAKTMIRKIYHAGNLREGAKSLPGVSTEQIILLQHAIELLESQLDIMNSAKSRVGKSAGANYMMILLGFFLWGPVSEWIDPYGANDGLFGYAPW